MLRKFVTIFGGDPNKRELEKYSAVIEQVNVLEKSYEALSDEALRAKTAEFRDRLSQGETLDDLLPEAFAAVREASKRTIGQRHYDVQLVGGIVLHQGKIAEMRTGEGKTLVATLPLYLNALTGKGTHLITVNDYLARRDARWMGPIYLALGISVGVLQMAARTENAQKAFIVDLEHESPHEDQHQMRMVPRQEAYATEITYGTNSEFGFDYLRDNMAMRLEDRVQRGHHYAIVDEVDNVLIDEARTPLIISGPASEDVEWYTRMAQVVKALRVEDYETNERDRTVTLTEIGETHVEELLGLPLRDPERPEDVTPEQARLLGYLEQALRAQYLFKRNKDYLVQAGKVIIVDEFTGRLMPGRRWSDGLHQAVEAKEGTRVQPENVTYATITLQNYFRMYAKLAGMSGTALTEAEEFDKIYKLGVIAIPTNLEFIASRPESGLVDLEDRDEQGYKYQYYAQADDPQKKPVFWKRKDHPDVVYRTEEAKLRSLIQEIFRYHVMGRPMLVGTTSVELSERVSNRLRAEPLRRLAQTLLIRKAWFAKNGKEEEGRTVPELQFMNSLIDQLDISTMRKLARELDVSFNPEDPDNLERLLQILDLSPADRSRLVAALQGGIPHQVLNARKHTEESQIIAGAGAFGAVTIATNMAGRGVDIKLGGDLREEILSSVNRVLRRAGYDDPYDMTMEARRQALLKLDPSTYGIYEAEIQHYLKYMEDMGKVRLLGGLHVIGSERHEARRIDNQLRGRSARQGDPGSSRFYLSMEDNLMRLFGGGQADALMQRLKIDDALPLEVGLVGRLIEQSQTRVEGANFDVRKHLLEYDDVLNSQRGKIYSQRDRIFTKDDLSEDVTEMLRSEVNRRVPEALEDEEGPWKLIAWLDQVQPPLAINAHIFPSYSLRLLVDHIFNASSSGDGTSTIDQKTALTALLDIARQSLLAEEQHLFKAVKEMLDQAETRLESQIKEHIEAVDTFFEGLSLETEEEGEIRAPRQLLDELSATARLPIRLSNEEQRLLRDDPDQVIDTVRGQVQESLHNQAITRLVGAIERRVEEPLGFDTQTPTGDWYDISERISAFLQEVFTRRSERLLGGDGNGTAASGQIAQDLGNLLEKADGQLDKFAMLQLLVYMPQGARTSFDRKTHRRVQIRTTRLIYTYYAAQLLQTRDPQEVTEDVLGHLEQAQESITVSLGVNEWNRLASLAVAELSETSQRGLVNVLGEEAFSRARQQPLQALEPSLREKVIPELGRQTLTAVYRQLLLAVITELWVDYLTQMEALRVSIGLEAYGQRDPLVQYKSRASELFQELLNNMRLGVVTRMFTFRPRDQASVQISAPGAQVAEAVTAEPEKLAAAAEQPQAKQESREQGGKKRRRRHR
jgi:preprotein translocase subunit SecA